LIGARADSEIEPVSTTLDEFNMKKQPADLKDFDSLPNAAGVNVRTVAALCGCNTATVWNRSKDGSLPAPIKIGGSTRWNVGELRKVLAGGAA
jgi:predicted DNA-binding transcriptional regulator AlpA